MKNKLYIIVMALLLFIIISCAYTAQTHGIPNFLGYHFAYIPTESMVPTIQPGTLCLQSTDTKNLQIGDIVTYVRLNEDGSMPNTTVTHRIVGVNDDGTYILKGDNNQTADTLPVSNGQIAYKIVKIF